MPTADLLDNDVFRPLRFREQHFVVTTGNTWSVAVKSRAVEQPIFTDEYANRGSSWSSQGRNLAASVGCRGDQLGDSVFLRRGRRPDRFSDGAGHQAMTPRAILVWSTATLIAIVADANPFTRVFLLLAALNVLIAL